MHLFMYMYINNEKMIYYRKVIIPNDAKVIIYDKKKFKTDKFILSEKNKIEELWNNPNYCSAIFANYLELKDIFSISPNMLTNSFQYINNKTQKMCIIAINNDPFVLEYINNKDIDIIKIKNISNFV